MKYLLAFIILTHGLIHIMGFAKAFGYGNVTQLTRDISKISGIFWLGVFILFSVAAVFLLSNKDIWATLVIVAAIISQILIISVWKDAKFGTVANVVILVLTIPVWSAQRFESRFRTDVNELLARQNSVTDELLTESDIQHLPQPVQKYLRITGSINKPKIRNVRLVFNGEMRGKGKDWFPFRSVQYNYFDEPARLFFMRAKMMRMPVLGYHHYEAGSASMDVRLFGLFRVMEAHGAEMDKAETVTLFNDMCLMAPATLIDKRIQWEPIDDLSTMATFTNGKTSITATLYFNDAGQLVNFVSDDRYEINEGKRYRFSTPLKNYKVMDGRSISTYGETIWHYPEGEFVYGQFYLSEVKYNVTE